MNIAYGSKGDWQVHENEAEHCNGVTKFRTISFIEAQTYEVRQRRRKALRIEGSVRNGEQSRRERGTSGTSFPTISYAYEKTKAMPKSLYPERFIEMEIVRSRWFVSIIRKLSKFKIRSSPNPTTHARNGDGTSLVIDWFCMRFTGAPR